MPTITSDLKGIADKAVSFGDADGVAGDPGAPGAPEAVGAGAGLSPSRRPGSRMPLPKTT